MGRIFLFLCCFFSCLFSDDLEQALKNNALNNNTQQAKWKKFDFNKVKQPSSISKNSEVDFKNTFNKFLSSVLENPNGVDQTQGDIDFENKNIQVKNLSLLYENENNALMFQKEIYVAQDSYNYSGGIINRYAKDDFIFGVNGFIDKQREQKENKSLGGEFAYGKFIKAYTNYYIPEKDEEKNLQFGLSFVIPEYKSFNFDISKDNEKANYKISYSPYSIFSINIIRKDYLKTEDEDTVLELGFNLKFDQSFSSQLKNTNDTLEEVNRYDFLQRVN